MKTFWKNLELFKTMGKSDEEKAENEKGIQMLMDAKAELSGETTESTD
ncbi:MAG TPA: hypothetical protein DCW76_13000 [Lysinibacillus sp.]|nr:hypothetical protein [Lysinibacillus sp.]